MIFMGCIRVGCSGRLLIGISVHFLCSPSKGWKGAIVLHSRFCGFAALLLAVYAVSARADVTVEFVGEKFPMRLNASSEGKKEVLMRPGKLSLTGAEVTLQSEAFFTGGYYVLSRFQVNKGAKSEITMGTKVPLEDGDKITVYQVAIVPPPNAALVPFRDGSILVSLMYPAAVKNPDGFDGKEEFRSSTMFLAKYGSKAVSTKLAEQAVRGTEEKGFGHFRGDQQISVIRQSNPDGTLTKSQADVKPEDLAEAIQVGLIQIQILVLREEIQKAKDLLPKE